MIRKALKPHLGAPLDEALKVSLVFYLTRPKSVKRKRPFSFPDLDKLCRTVLDALQGRKKELGYFKDDSRVVELCASKAYADESESGVRIMVERVT